jgi:hypothetical protein
VGCGGQGRRERKEDGQGWVRRSAACLPRNSSLPAQQPRQPCSMAGQGRPVPSPCSHVGAVRQHAALAPRLGQRDVRAVPPRGRVRRRRRQLRHLCSVGRERGVDSARLVGLEGGSRWLSCALLTACRVHAAASHSTGLALFTQACASASQPRCASRYTTPKHSTPQLFTFASTIALCCCTAEAVAAAAASAAATDRFTSPSSLARRGAQGASGPAERASGRVAAHVTRMDLQVEACKNHITSHHPM